MGSPEARAERLRVLIAVAPFLPMPPEELADALPSSDLQVLAGATLEDLDLANACLAVESSMRAEMFQAVERLGALVAGGSGGLSDRVGSLPFPERVDAIQAIMDCLWVDR